MIAYNYGTKVYYKDIDQMGIVYYSRYFEFFEAARTELFASIDLNVTEIESHGVYLPVVHAECDYHEGAKFEDNLIIRTEIREMPKFRLMIHYVVTRASDTKKLVTGQKRMQAHLVNARNGNVRPEPKKREHKKHKKDFFAQIRVLKNEF